MSGLGEAVALVDEARSRAELRGDPEAAWRLARLRDLLDDERGYEELVERGFPPVRRCAHPPGATIGWLFAHCASTRAARRILGVSVPDLPVADSGGVR